MKTSDYSYNLPAELIADTPPKTRGLSRLLVLDKSNGEVEDRAYADLPAMIQPGDVVVLNDTKVIPARLKVTKVSSGVERELVLVEKHGKSDDWHQHKAMYRRKLSVGDVLLTTSGDTIHVDELLGDGIALVSSDKDLLEIAYKDGTVPLPPYMHRDADANDLERYQTVWAEHAGSVAAPTASLNMTQDFLQQIRDIGAEVVYATLHVGLGTFMPIRVEDVENHVMHKEYYEIPRETLMAIRHAKANGKRVIAIGTTITRTLEYAAREILIDEPQDLQGEADIFIYPGYEFKVVDCLVTNFHAPDSTVLMLTAAFAGWNHLETAYKHAVEHKYRFLSYGDSMFIYASSSNTTDTRAIQ